MPAVSQTSAVTSASTWICSRGHRHSGLNPLLLFSNPFISTVLSSTVFARPALQPFLTLFSVGKMMMRTRKKKTKTWVINRSCVVWSQDYFIHLVSDRWWCHFQRPISGPRFSLGSPAPRSHGRCGSVRSGLRGLPQVAGGRLCPRVQPAVGSHRGQSGENDIAWYTHFQPLSRDNVQLRNGYNLKWEYQY